MEYMISNQNIRNQINLNSKGIVCEIIHMYHFCSTFYLTIQSKLTIFEKGFKRMIMIGISNNSLKFL